MRARRPAVRDSNRANSEGGLPALPPSRVGVEEARRLHSLELWPATRDDSRGPVSRIRSGTRAWAGFACTSGATGRGRSGNSAAHPARLGSTASNSGEPGDASFSQNQPEAPSTEPRRTRIRSRARRCRIFTAPSVSPAAKAISGNERSSRYRKTSTSRSRAASSSSTFRTC